MPGIPWRLSLTCTVDSRKLLNIWGLLMLRESIKRVVLVFVKESIRNVRVAVAAA